MAPTAAIAAPASITSCRLPTMSVTLTSVPSAATVKSHVNHIFAKIGARDRAQAVVYAYANGLTASR